MNHYETQWFSSIDWEWKNHEVLAESEEQVRELVAVMCKPEFRNKPYNGDKVEDSLSIDFVAEVKFPLFIS